MKESSYDEIELFGQTVKIKNYFCSYNQEKFEKADVRINLYIKINDACNGKCKFCSNNGLKDNGKLDLDKLKETLIYLNEKDIINRISVTGGEPLLNIELLNKVLNLVFSVNPNFLVTFNTNGYNLKSILNLDSIDKIEGIHISRHHYNDKINNDIFGLETASNDEIKYVMNKLKNKKLLRLNCLLMKDYIGNSQEVKKYLEKASDLGIFRVGFVGLMKVNDYCKENFISINDVFNNMNDNNCNISHSYDKNICECLNGVYISKSGKLIEYYARMTKELNCEYSRQLVYTSDNRLTTGFGQKSLI